MGKRTRACEECHRLKIKCDVGDWPADKNNNIATNTANDADDDESGFRSNSGRSSARRSCERCVRNNLNCIPAAPRLQRDRISELESQVEQLKSELLLAKSQPTAASNSGSPSTTPSSSSLGCSCSSSSQDGHHRSHSVSSPHDYHRGGDVLSFLDARLPHAKQQELLHAFVYDIAPAWPIVLLPTDDLDHARRESRVLLLCILTYTVTRHDQGASQEVHDDLIRESMRILGDEIVVRGQQSIELVLSLLVAGFWSKTAQGDSHASAFQLTQIASDMAIDLGLAGTSVQATPAAYFRRKEDPSTAESRRTWLACFLCMAAASVSTRRPIAVPWNDYHHECLLYLESLGGPSDLLLCQLVRVSVLTQEIATSLHMCSITTFLDGNTYTTHAIMDDLKARAATCAAQVLITSADGNHHHHFLSDIDPSIFSITSSAALSPPPPPSHNSGLLRILWHVAMIYIHEPLFWTVTNMSSFTAPFIPGRIAVHDFARPTHPIPPLEAALPAIVTHCHAVVDIAAAEEGLGPSTIVHLPSFCTAPLVTYSLYMLVNVLVATTGPRATYARYIPPETLRVGEYLAKLRGLNSRLRVVDPTMSCYTTRILDATGWLEQWYNDYVVIVQRFEASLGA
ncbi:transcriptional regulatory protein LEU3 [Microdochium nivale]|nr:transcriptional regulatory protein LEU3 [Microdochium nivale]